MGPKTPQKKKLTKEVFDRNYSVIEEAMIRAAREKSGNSPLTAEDVEIHHLSKSSIWREGTRSLTRIFKLESDDLDQNYIVKAVPANHIEDAITERAVVRALNQSKNTREIFADIVGYRKVPNAHLIISERPALRTFYDTLEGKDEIQHNELIGPLRPIIALHEHTSPELIDKIEENLTKYCMRYKLRKKVAELDRLDPFDYAKNLTRYLCQDKKVPKSLKTEINQASFAIARAYFTRKALECVIQHDGYPWNHLTKCLIDAGDMKMGSPAIHLGCFIGHPSVYERLVKEEGASSSFDKREAIESLVKYYSDVRGGRFNKDHLTAGIYAGAVYANLRLTLGSYFDDDAKSELKSTVIEQLRVLGDDNLAAKTLSNALLDIQFSDKYR